MAACIRPAWGVPILQKREPNGLAREVNTKCEFAYKFYYFIFEMSSVLLNIILHKYSNFTCLILSLQQFSNFIYNFTIIFSCKFCIFIFRFLKIFTYTFYKSICISLNNFLVKFSICLCSYRRDRWTSKHLPYTLQVNFGDVRFELLFKTKAVLRRKLMKKIENHLEVVDGALGLRYPDGSLVSSRFVHVNGGTVAVFIRDCVGANGFGSDRVTYENHVVTCAYSNTRGHSKEKLMAIKVATAQDRDFVANELNLTEIDVVSLANGIAQWRNSDFWWTKFTK